MKILINGICGHMGREVLTLCEAGYRGAECIGGVDAFAKGGVYNLPYEVGYSIDRYHNPAAS